MKRSIYELELLARGIHQAPPAKKTYQGEQGRRDAMKNVPTAKDYGYRGGKFSEAEGDELKPQTSGDNTPETIFRGTEETPEDDCE